MYVHIRRCIYMYIYTYTHNYVNSMTVHMQD